MRALLVALLLACSNGAPAKLPIEQTPPPVTEPTPKPAPIVDAPDPEPPLDRKRIDAPVGEFEGTERGHAEGPRGDPYLAKLAADVQAAWHPGSLASPDRGVGCVQLSADGRVAKHEVRPSGNADLDAAVDRTLAAVAKLRADKPEPVPEHLRASLSKWICFRLAAQP
jgi:hypothetical protein